MYTIKQLFKNTFFAGLAIVAVSCSKDKTDNTVYGDYVLGVGVTIPNGTANYVVQVGDLMTGTISLEGNGILQTGYRDYAFGGSKFYSIGGLGVNDVTTYSLDGSGKLAGATGLNLAFPNNDFVDADGTGASMVGVSVPTSSSVSTNEQFYIVNSANNTMSTPVNVPMNSVHPTSQDWFFHSGMQVRGNQLFQTFYPANSTTYATDNVDTNYVAVFSYPGFVLEKVIKDTRTGPSGAFNNRSGLFKTESGDLYTVSTSSFSGGYSKSTKPAGVLKIAAGTSEFDADYFWNTDTAPNGGKIAHAIYIGNGKLFAAVTTVTPTLADRWADKNLKLSIVDLVNKTITPVANAPLYTGDGGRSFATLFDGGKVYSAITGADGICNIYQTDIATATATKGAVVQGSFVGGIAKMK